MNSSLLTVSSSWRGSGCSCECSSLSGGVSGCTEHTNFTGACSVRMRLLCVAVNVLLLVAVFRRVSAEQWNQEMFMKLAGHFPALAAILCCSAVKKYANIYQIALCA